MNSKVILEPKDSHEKGSKLVGLNAKFEDLTVHYDAQKKQNAALRDKLAELNAEHRDTKEKLM